MAQFKKVLWLTVVVLATYLPVAVFAQDAVDYSADLGSLKNKLEEIQSTKTTDTEGQSRLVDYYTQAITYLESAKSDKAQANDFAKSIKTAPANLARIQQELDQPDSKPKPLPANLEALEQELLNKQTQLLLLNSQLSENRAAIAAEQDLDLPMMLAAALQQQTLSLGKLSQPLTEKSVDLIEAQRIHRSAEVAARGARVEMLQQRSLSRDARLSEWRAQQRLITRKITTVDARVAAYQEAVNDLRQSRANELAQETQDRASSLDTSNGPARFLANQNSALAKRMAEVTKRTEDLFSQLARLRAERTRIDRYYDSVSQQLAVSGANRLPDLGIELLEQKRKLSQLDSLTLKLEENDKEIARAQLELLRLEDQQVEQANNEPNQSQSTQVVKQLEDEQKLLLQNTTSSFRRYIEVLSATRTEGQALQLRTTQYRELLESRLFWIPSTTRISWSMFKELGIELKWLFAPTQWRQVVHVIVENIARNLLPALVILGLSLLLFSIRKKLKIRLELQAVNIGKVESDRAYSTWVALLLSLLMALPGPLVLLSVAALIFGGDMFAAHLTKGLVHAAMLWFLLAVFWQICRPEGLAEKHFKWSAKSLATVRRSLPWVMKVLVPVALLTPLVDGASDGIAQDAISRVLFTIASLVLAYFSLRVLRPNSAVLKSLEEQDSPWQKPVQYLIFPLAVLLPLVLLVLSWLGYHFTALALESRLFVSAVVLVTVALLYHLTMRAIAVTERRMALERILIEREIERKAIKKRKAADHAAEGMPEVLDLREIDLQTINSQAHAFVKMVFILLAGFGLWLLWSDVLPALGVFDEIVLWHVTAADVHLPDKAVTLANIMVAGLVVFLTYFGAKNIPGSLEVVVLRRFKLEPGTGYAITTMVKYIIVFAGIMVMLNLIGAQWSKLQWLVAALGVGLGFGLQEIVANFVSGILILFERPVRVGDTVTVGSQTGTVSRIRMRATTLTDWDRKEQIIPNKTFITEPLTNWTLTDPITRVIIKVGVAYGSDIELVHKTLSESISANKRVVADPPPAVFFVGFGDSSLDFEIRVFIQSMLDLMPLKHELHVSIDRNLRDHGIVIPFPQRDLWIRTEAQPVGAEDFAPENANPNISSATDLAPDK
jgi:potassium efflux system protein